MTREIELVIALKQTVNEIEQVAREIYYALSFLEETHPSRANLVAALRIIGVNKPADVGLSNSVLYRNVK